MWYNLFMPDAQGALELFHPVIRLWFASSVGTPTDIQERAWPAIARGEHVLVTAPTGSGKTLCAFLWAIQKLLTGDWQAGTVRVLYVSPLKALNTDIRLNLLGPLAALQSAFAESSQGKAVPRVQVHTRSGDTPPDERRRTLKHPPEILITTPESLNILLTSGAGEALFRGLATVILDEIHAVAGSKRGTHLITAVERLTLLSGELQRVALSATVRPLEVVADFVGGRRPQGDPAAPAYLKRPVTILASSAPKEYQIEVRAPPPPTPEDKDAAGAGLTEGTNPLWPPLVRELRQSIGGNTSTLIFTNSRRLAEKIAYLVNEGQERQIAYAHHGSLSREVRTEVERKLKAGELEAIVATSSLELGIDVGALDEVILIQTPFSVSSLLQRVGRAGHSVGLASRGTVYPTYGMDFVASAVTVAAARSGDIEETRPVRCPLDVLAQLLVSMTARATWKLEELYGFVKTSFPYHDLKREHFDLVVEMLAGRYEDSRLRSLKPLVSVDRVDGTMRAREGAVMLLYSSGGTIPDRGYFTLRTADTKARLGELDEEFVWERSVGDRFMLGTQAWRIQKIDYQNVEVVPAGQRVGMTPFWRAESFDRGFPLSERIGLALEEWNRFLDEPEGADRVTADLRERCCLDTQAAERLVGFLVEQRAATRCQTPHRRHLVVERYADPLASTESRQVILHTLWGGKVNRPVALVLAEAWRARHGSRIECFADNDGVLVLAPRDVGAEDLLGLLDPDRFPGLLRKSLEATGIFGARFRENAARALLLPSSLRKRMPLWLNRLRAKKLMDAVLGTPDFPILLETWRSCMEEELDPQSAVRVLDELRSGSIRVTEVSTRAPSPFCDSLVYRQTNKYMYQGDEPERGAVSGLSDELIRDFLSASHLELALSEELIAGLEAKLRRTAPGYTPSSARELLDWVVERLAIPMEEWEELLDAIRRDVADGEPEAPDSWVADIGDKLVTRTLPGASVPVVVARESVARLDRSLGDIAAASDELTGLVAEWIRFSGPLLPARLTQVMGIPPAVVDAVIASLKESRLAVFDRLRSGSREPELCDAENLEILLRMRRSRARPEIEPLPAQAVPLFLAAHQGLCARGTDAEVLKQVLERLFGFPAPAELWEEEILPARLDPYYPAWLDSLVDASGLVWFGCGKERSSFALAQDLELYLSGGRRAEGPEIDRLFPDRRARYSFWDLLDRAGGDSAFLAATLWQHVWKGRMANDSYQTLRRGIRTRFTADESRREGGGRVSRASISRWQSSRPATGSWFVLSPTAREPEEDLLAEEELRKDRVRQLLERYGVVYRELVEHELPPLSWRELFRTLRLMELSGEIVSGLFFRGPTGPQFASYAAVRRLESGLPEQAIYWMSAVDPASPCGRRIAGSDSRLPPRLKGTHLVFEGRELRLVSRRAGKMVEVHAPPDHPRMAEILGLFRNLVGRQMEPVNSVVVERVNGEAAASSTHAAAFLAAGFVKDYRHLVLRARY